ncbi:hypothetical protein J4216_04490 [Candidatus Woesearchaeota archaeon]|nr:hypothetical protein [Candidatus Woesearchaeota archaeon]
MEKKCDYFDLLDYLPKEIVAGENGNKYELFFKADEKYISLSYISKHSNNSQQEHSLTIPRFIFKNQETFEVLGLLQAEMGKTQNGSLNFANSEPRLINKVFKWFDKWLEIKKEEWKWSIKVNSKEPSDSLVKKEIENKVIDYWIKETTIKLEESYPKKVTYTNVEHTRLKRNYYGTLIIEIKKNLLSQIIKKFIYSITYNVLLYESKDNIRSFMSGLIAGEGCVSNERENGHYSVHISDSNVLEREIYRKCMAILHIELKIYNNYSETLISQRHNLVQLLKQRLMTLHQVKYKKFLYMMQKYPGIKEETNYFTGKKPVWHKTPKEVEDKIIEIYNSGITNTKEISEKIKLGRLKVQRVLKENNLGKRVVKIQEELRKQIADLAKNNPKIKIEEIAKQFNVSKQIGFRAYHKYYGKRGMGASRKIPEEIEKRIIQIYKDNPEIKYSKIMGEFGISSTTIKRIRKENDLTHLGFKHLVGNNNKKRKKQWHIITTKMKVPEIITT